MNVSDPKIIKVFVSFFSNEITSIFIPVVLLICALRLDAMFFPSRLFIGKKAAHIGERKLTKQARKRLSVLNVR